MTTQHNEHVLVFWYWELIRLGRREAAAKQWAKKTGHYYGAQGGWIYYTATHRAVCQGWLTLFDRHKNAIVTAIAEGLITVRRTQGFDRNRKMIADYKREQQRTADHIDGYDRDDLGLSPDY